jgi:hypothetical protein
MADLSNTVVRGDIEKLTQIGRLEGNVFVTSSETLKKFVEDEDEREKFIEATPYISVTLVSQRFGRRVQLQVPPDIAAGALAASIVRMLKLPRNHRVEELGFELIFSYTMRFGNNRVGPWTKLSTAGITEGSEIGMQIDFRWKDPVSTPSSNDRPSLSGGGFVMYRFSSGGEGV